MHCVIEYTLFWFCLSVFDAKSVLLSAAASGSGAADGIICAYNMQYKTWEQLQNGSMELLVIITYI